MRVILCFSLFFSGGFFLRAQPEMIPVRQACYTASKSGGEASRFYQSFNDYKVLSPVLKGYKALAELMICNHSYNPYTKLNYFSKGKSTLESAIAADPASVELRFLRFSVQSNAPAFLGYNTNLDEDKALLLTALQKRNIDDDLFARIRDFMLSSKAVTTVEKKMITAS